MIEKRNDIIYVIYNVEEGCFEFPSKTKRDAFQKYIDSFDDIDEALTTLDRITIESFTYEEYEKISEE